VNICEEDIEFFFLHLNLITLNKEISNIVMGPIKLSFFLQSIKNIPLKQEPTLRAVLISSMKINKSRKLHDFGMKLFFKMFLYQNRGNFL